MVRDVEGQPNTCYNELVSYVRTNFLLGFSLNFLEIFIPIIKDKLTLKTLKIRREYSWGLIDRMIEQEWIEKDPYQTTMEIDGVLNEYMEIALLFSFLALFAQVLPIGFLLGFLTAVSEIFIDKYKFLKIIRRPIPKGASDIGTWALIANLVSFFAIFINVGLLTFTSNSADFIAHDFLRVQNFLTDDKIKTIFRFQHFVFLSLLLVLIRRAIEEVVPDIPKDLEQLLLRQNLILENMKFNKKKQMGTRPRTGLLVGNWVEEDIINVVSDLDDMKFVRESESKHNKLIFFNS